MGRREWWWGQLGVCRGFSSGVEALAAPRGLEGLGTVRAGPQDRRAQLQESRGGSGLRWGLGCLASTHLSLLPAGILSPLLPSKEPFPRPIHDALPTSSLLYPKHSITLTLGLVCNHAPLTGTSSLSPSGGAAGIPRFPGCITPISACLNLLLCLTFLYHSCEDPPV